MSQKKMKEFRRQFRKAYKSAGQATGYEAKFKNVLKIVTLSQERRRLKQLIEENRRLPKDKRRSFFTILADAPKAGAQYLKKATRIEADEVRQRYQQEKRLFRYGYVA